MTMCDTMLNEMANLRREAADNEREAWCARKLNELCVDWDPDLETAEEAYQDYLEHDWEIDPLDEPVRD